MQPEFSEHLGNWEEWERNPPAAWIGGYAGGGFTNYRDLAADSIRVGKVRMFEKFTDRSRKVCQLANKFAQSLNHEYVGTEHLLVGLDEEKSGVAANVLRLYFPPGKIKETILSFIERGPDMITIGKLPMTPKAKRAIEHAEVEARNLGHEFIGTEHLLLGLMCEDSHVAYQVLETSGKPIEEIRTEVLRLLGQDQPKGKDTEVAKSPLVTTKTKRCYFKVTIIEAEGDGVWPALEQLNKLLEQKAD